MTDLEPGSPVVTNDAEYVASVRSVGQEYIVAAPRRGAGLLYIPASAVGNVHSGMVWLNVASGSVATMGWDVPRARPTLPDRSRRRTCTDTPERRAFRAAPTVDLRHSPRCDLAYGRRAQY